MKEEIKGFIFIILAMAIFGFYGIFVRFLNLSSQLILFFNSFFVAIILFFAFLKQKEKFSLKQHRLIILFLGMTFVANNFCYFKAFQLTTIANAILTHYTAPIFVAILAPLFLREKLEKITLISLIISFFGLFLIASEGLSLSPANFLGILFGTASGLAYAFSIIIYKYLLRDLSVYTLIFYQSLMGSIILTPFVLPQISTSLPWFYLLSFALLFGIFATFLHFQGIKRIKAQQAGILGYTEPVFGTIYAFIFFAEIPTIPAFIGGALIILSGYLIFRA
jgi:drug/metabolite transporter (DMT)-like permease